MIFQSINLLIIVLSWITAFFSIRSYIKASFNKTDSLYWGLSFILIGFTFLLHLISSYLSAIDYKSLSVVIHFLNSYILLTQFFIVIRLFQEYTNKSNREVRISRVLAGFFKISLLGLFVYFLLVNFNFTFFNTPPNQNLQIFDLNKGDIILESIHSAILLIMVILIPNISYYCMLQLGFFLILVSKVFQIINIVSYQYSHCLLITFEWMTYILGTISILLSVLAITKTTYSCDARKEDRRAEECDLKQIQKLKEKISDTE